MKLFSYHFSVLNRRGKGRIASIEAPTVAGPSTQGVPPPVIVQEASDLHRKIEHDGVLRKRKLEHVNQVEPKRKK